jgi:O-antigen biosynthesis protein WbqV
MFTGMRPGEKLYEELFDKSEKIIPTFHKKIFMAVPEAPPITVLDGYIANLDRVIQDYSVDRVVPIIQKIVPSFKNQNVQSESFNKEWVVK